MRKSSFSNLKRATVIVALFLFSALTQAEKTKPVNETHKDIIEKAYNLMLQKERSQAMSLLASAIKKEGKKSAAAKEIQTAMSETANLFYSDKAQQLFELALSLKTTDLSVALSKLNEAAKIEPDNMTIEVAAARAQIALADCDAATNRLVKYKEIVPYIEELELALFQAKICRGQIEDYAIRRATIDSKKMTLQSGWIALEAEYSIKLSDFVKSKQAAISLQQLDPAFPEGYYWEWKALSQLKLKSERQAQKYLNLCKTLTSRQVRAYQYEPNLCRRMAEVETYLKKMNNSEI